MGVLVCCAIVGVKTVASEPTRAIETANIPGLGLTLVKVKAGSFIMGHPEGYPASSADERSAHKVNITKDFWLGATSVTVGQFRQFVEQTGYVTDAEFRNRGPRPASAGETRACPTTSRRISILCSG